MKKKVIIKRNNEPYLIRYNIFNCGLFSIKVHHIIESDDACLHDHPWAFVSIILKGGYIEERVKKWLPLPADYDYETYNKPNIIIDTDLLRYGIKVRRMYHPGNILFRKSKSLHRLEIVQTAWTLVITLKRTRIWGFFTPSGWVPWYTYSQQNSCE